MGGGDALERVIDSARDKGSGIWVGKRGLGTLGRGVQLHIGGHINLYHAAIILDGTGYSFDPNNNSGGDDLQTFPHNSKEASSYEWKRIAGHFVKKSDHSILSEAKRYATNYHLLKWNCQIFCQKMSEYASDSKMIDTGVAF